MSDDRTLRTVLAEACRAADVPGAALALLTHGDVVTAEAGVVDVTSQHPVTAATRFPIGSITKGFTATLVLQLVEAGQLRLDDPIVRYLPEFSLGGSSAPLVGDITIRHLLANTSGLPGVDLDEPGDGDDALERYLRQCQGLELLHRPGERFAYCNAGFVLAGLIVERLRGQVWDDVLLDRLLRPLGLVETGSRRDQLGDSLLASQHQRSPEQAVTVVPPWRPRAGGPAGATMFATAADLDTATSRM